MKEIEVEVNQSFKKIEFVRLSQKSTIYIDNHRLRTWLCLKCGSIVHSKIDHTRWHQQIVDMIVGATNDKELALIEYQPIEKNPIIKERQGITSIN